MRMWTAWSLLFANFSHAETCNDSSVTDSVLFTVFTPTYNRAHTLHRVYDSLCAQTLRDFEWLVVDDGSTDNTMELVGDWAKTARFPISYFKQNHSGKHVAHNLAAREARGQFFLPLDSDDACLPVALERMLHHWNAIPVAERAGFLGVEGLCIDQNGQVIGDQYPSDPFDTTLRERKYIYRLHGEKWGSALTEVVRRFPFANVEDTQFVPEGTIWLEMAKTYKDRCVNEVFRIYYVDDHETGTTLTRKNRFRENAPGRWHYYIWLLNNDIEYLLHAPVPFLKAAVMLPIVGHVAGKGLGGTLRSLRTARSKFLVGLALPLSCLLYAYDTARAARTKKKPIS
jgi:glycosyltransferase involved in cell wall biosynthesis